MLSDFDTQIQIEEIIPEEYEDWLRYCAGIYEEEIENIQQKEN